MSLEGSTTICDVFHEEVHFKLLSKLPSISHPVPQCWLQGWEIFSELVLGISAFLMDHHANIEFQAFCCLICQVFSSYSVIFPFSYGRKNFGGSFSLGILRPLFWLHCFRAFHISLKHHDECSSRNQSINNELPWGQRKPTAGHRNS